VDPKRIMITGAGSGFGRAAALSLAAGGHDVIAAAHHAAEVDEMRAESAARGVSLRVERLDLLSEADRDAARGWGVDVLVNNAAVGAGGPIAEMPLERVRILGVVAEPAGGALGCSG
jgi:NAD(P)-dependent dehydrogenase (short-subunit alcohol dehydrogenase family)